METRPDPSTLDAAQLDRHRTALTGHCFRMMASVSDAEDAVQETMIRAWRSLDRFDGRSALRTWLYRIATNVCLDMLKDRERRIRPVESFSLGTIDDELSQLPRRHWLEPVPDALAIPADSDPAEALELRQSIRLAFVSALQHLPPKQRAVLLLSEVLGWSAKDVAECLESSVASVNSALQRARATLASRGESEAQAPLSDEQQSLVDRFEAAFLSYDVDEIVSLLRSDATLSMPPYTLWLQGRESIRGWLLGRGSGCRGSRLVRTSACGLPAFGQYRPSPDGGHTPWAVVVLEPGDDGIAAWNAYLDTETLFPLFGLPDRL